MRTLASQVLRTGRRCRSVQIFALALLVLSMPQAASGVVTGPDFPLTSPQGFASEPTIAAQVNHVVAVYLRHSNPEVISRASSDGGATWQPELGGLITGPFALCAGDSGRFFLITGPAEVFEGRFLSGVFGWQRMTPAATTPPGVSGPVAGSIAFDPQNGNLYAVFHRNSYLIESVGFSRSTDGGQTWGAEWVLTGGGVSAGKLVVGPTGDVTVVWENYLTEKVMARRSTDHGASFEPEFEVTPILDPVAFEPTAWQGNHERRHPGVPGIIVSDCMKAPAAFDVAVDRSDGARRGTIYLVTTERPSGTIGPEIPVTFENRFVRNAGQSIWISGMTAPSPYTINAYYGLSCGDTATGQRLGSSCATPDGKPGAVVTLPTSGSYRAQTWLAYTYLLLNEFIVDPASVARDHRDLLLTWSTDGGATWSPKKLVSDGPIGNEEAFPEIAVDDAGRVHLVWYDRRDALNCGGEVNTYWTYSDDGGMTFVPSRRVSQVGSTWTYANQWWVGDHLGLAPAGDKLHFVWTRTTPWDVIVGSVIDLEPGDAPQISSVSPAGAAPGTMIEIHGVHFSEATAVVFHDQSVPFTVVHDGLITTHVPFGGRTGFVTVADPPQMAQSLEQFFVEPRISRLLPSRAWIGESVRIEGVNFTGATEVRFNGTPGVFTIVSDTMIVASVPSGATSGTITVTGPGGTGESGFVVGHHPSGINLSWDDCGTHGVALKTFACTGTIGPPFILIGSFVPPDSVDRMVGLTADLRIIKDDGALPDWWKFTSSPCRNGVVLPDYNFSQDFNSCDDPSLHWGSGFSYDIAYAGAGHARMVLFPAVVPDGIDALDAAHEYYAFKLVVSRAQEAVQGCTGCSQPLRMELRSIQLFQEPSLGFDPVLSAPLTRSVAYWQSAPPPPPPVPLSFEPTAGAPGTPVTLAGEGFAGATAVTFGGFGASFTVVSDIAITTQVPDGARTGPVRVTTPAGIKESATAFIVAPVLQSFSPAQAPVGAKVGIAGYNLTATTAVTIGGVPASEFEIPSDDLLVATVPAGAVGGPIQVTNPGGSDVSDDSFTVGPFPPAAEGINLAWGDCGVRGAPNQTFACDVNSGPPFTLVASFRPPPEMFQYLGLSAVLTVGNPIGALPDWWRHGSGECRGTAALTVSADFTGGPYTCNDFFQGQAVAGLLYVPEASDPRRARVMLQAAIPAFLQGPLLPGTEYYGFALRLLRTKSTGTGSCAGCATPVCIELNSIQLYQPGGLDFDPLIDLPADNTVVSFQGPVACGTITPVLASLVASEARFDQVRIVWELSRQETATLYRRSGGGAWRAVSGVATGAERRIEYVDREVVPGGTYGYRLGITVRGEEVFAGETAVTVPLPERLELHGMAWSGNGLTATLTLRGSGIAELEVFDLNGRRAAGHRIEGAGAGRHQIEIPVTLQPGVYFGRVIEGSLSATRRFAVVR